jgi:hypothetical protein
MRIAEVDLSRPATVLVAAIAVRVAAVGGTTVLGVNPSSEHDAVRFASQAAGIAQQLLGGTLSLSELASPVWGHFLAVYWLVPGPSVLYGRLGNAILGALAVYNVYCLARHYASHRAGVVAVLPLIVFPSYNAVQSSLLRESLTLFCITTACRVLAFRGRTDKRLSAYAVAGLLLWVALRMRPANRVIYAITLVVGVGIALYEAGYISQRLVLLGGVAAVPGVLLSVPFIRDGIAYLADIRIHRMKGRTLYLADVVPDTIPAFIAFSWVGAAYFLYAPFPWQIATGLDLVVGIESIVSLGLTVFAITGVKLLARRDAAVTGALVVGFVVAAVLYGVGTVNYGTGMRHRQMFMWVLFLFGGIGVAHRVRITGRFED